LPGLLQKYAPVQRKLFRFTQPLCPSTASTGSSQIHQKHLEGRNSVFHPHVSHKWAASLKTRPAMRCKDRLTPSRKACSLRGLYTYPFLLFFFLPPSNKHVMSEAASAILNQKASGGADKAPWFLMTQKNQPKA
jgi:hypothetical protein